MSDNKQMVKMRRTLPSHRKKPILEVQGEAGLSVRCEAGNTGCGPVPGMYVIEVDTSGNGNISFRSFRITEFLFYFLFWRRKVWSRIRDQ